MSERRGHPVTVRLSSSEYAALRRIDGDSDADRVRALLRAHVAREEGGGDLVERIAEAVDRRVEQRTQRIEEAMWEVSDTQYSTLKQVIDDVPRRLLEALRTRPRGGSGGGQ